MLALQKEVDDGLDGADAVARVDAQRQKPWRCPRGRARQVLQQTNLDVHQDAESLECHIIAPLLARRDGVEEATVVGGLYLLALDQCRQLRLALSFVVGLHRVVILGLARTQERDCERPKLVGVLHRAEGGAAEGRELAATVPRNLARAEALRRQQAPCVLWGGRASVIGRPLKAAPRGERILARQRVELLSKALRSLVEVLHGCARTRQVWSRSRPARAPFTPAVFLGRVPIRCW